MNGEEVIGERRTEFEILYAAAAGEPARGAGARDVAATTKHGGGRAANCGGGGCGGVREAEEAGTRRAEEPSGTDGGVGRSRGARAGPGRVWTVKIKGSRSDG